MHNTNRIDLYQIDEEKEGAISDVVVGIDLGTTNSLIAYIDAVNFDASYPLIDKVRIVEYQEAGSTYNHIPSVVRYLGDGSKVIGHAAVNFSDSIRNSKRFMGIGVHELQKNMDIPSDIDMNASSPDSVFYKTISGVPISVIEVASDIISFLKSAAEKEIGQKIGECEIRKCVITVPAYFTENARLATIKAANMVGLEVLRLLNEPTAAAIAYGLSKNADGISLFYDLGGGTFDVAILKMENGVFRVLSTCGDTSLGGNDFDIALLRLLCHKKSNVEVNGILGVRDLYKSNNAFAEAIGHARSIRESMSNNPNNAWIGLFEGVKITVLQEELDSCFNNLVSVMFEIVEDAIKVARLTPQDIGKVFLVGGATRMPVVKKVIKKIFGFDPICQINPDEVVAVGAAIQAYSLVHQVDHLVIDVTALSLGIETYGGGVEVMIPKNSILPAIVTKSFTTSHENQTGFVINVLQGEEDEARKCTSLSKFTLSNLPIIAGRELQLEVTFSIDASGILTVTVVELSSGMRRMVEISASRI